MNFDKLKILLEGSTTDGINCHSASIAYGNGSAMEVETGIFLYGLVRRFQPKVCLETGTHKGFSTSFIALGLEDVAVDYPRLQGRVYTVDSGLYDGPEELWARLGVRHLIERVHGDSKTIEPVPHNISLVLLDSDHGDDHLVAEFAHFFPHFHPQRTIVLFHDSRLDKRMAPGINTIIDSMGLLEVYKHVRRLALRNMRGLDILFLSNEEL